MLQHLFVDLRYYFGHPFHVFLARLHCWLHHAYTNENDRQTYRKNLRSNRPIPPVGFSHPITMWHLIIPPYVSLALPFSHLDSPLYLGGFRGKSTSFLYPGTAEPSRISPAKPVAYIMESPEPVKVVRLPEVGDICIIIMNGWRRIGLCYEYSGRACQSSLE